MAHKLHIDKTGKASFAAYGEKAWHGLGQYFEARMTAAQAIEAANLGYTVIKQAIKTEKGVVIPDRYATVRKDTGIPLGIVGDRYEIIQNADAFGFFDAIIEAGEAIYETAGVLGNGERMFLTAKLPEDFTIKGDKIEQYILLTTSHDGWSPFLAGLTPVRVVCNNTLTAALGDLKNKVAIRHTVSAKEKIGEASRIMGICSAYMQEVNVIFDKMAKVKITDKKLKDYIMQVLVPKKETLTAAELKKDYSTRSVNAADEIIEFALHHPTQTTDATKRTLFGAYNSISGYYNFNKEYATSEEKMRDVMFDGVSAKVNRAFGVAVGMLK